MTQTDVSILVVSCDQYADLWPIFFAVFRQMWQDCGYPIFLGTNHKKCSEAGVTTLAIGEDRSWTENLREMLDHLNMPYVLLFLEDFLLTHAVNTAEVQYWVQLARKRRVDCLRLVAGLPLAFPPGRAVPDVPGVGIIEHGDPYRVSAQVAVWNRETLKRYAMPGLTAWEFEEIGTQASHYTNDLFWAMYKPVIRYQQCVEKGRWKPEGLVICRELGIQPDLEARAAFTPEEWANYLKTGEQNNRLGSERTWMVAHFFRGERKQGVIRALKALSINPIALDIWFLLLAGIISPSLIRWLKYKGIARKLRNQHEATV